MGIKIPQRKDLNSAQKLILNLFEDNNQTVIAVRGGPGTGKTILAIEAASLFKSEKILFLTYGSILNKAIEQVNDVDLKNIEIKSVWSWFLSLKSHNILGPIIKRNTPNPKDPFSVDLDAVYEEFSNFRMNWHDIIFIDEGQDLVDPFIKILKLFTTKIIITFDDNQTLGDDHIKFDNNNPRSIEILKDLSSEDRYFDLIENERNKSSVASVVNKLIDLNDSNIVDNRENKPKLLILENKYDYCLELLFKKIINEYINSKRNLEEKDISLIFNIEKKESLCIKMIEKFKKFAKDTYYNYLDFYEPTTSGHNFKNLYYKYGNFWKYNNVDPIDKYGKKKYKYIDFNSKNIYLLTYKSVKGLDFDSAYVFVDDYDIDNFYDKNAFYVASTRSRGNITFIVFANNTDKLTKKILENTDLFEEVKL